MRKNMTKSMHSFNKILKKVNKFQKISCNFVTILSVKGNIRGTTALHLYPLSSFLFLTP
jgi:hypothetical protein